ncbi:MAG: DegT/DnrJ/EryC1/StrS family aminotransferase [Tolypothrix brevis GSE-NOS-MK-07-07A]|jgi:dTDP-4-amino-4,6-dideoxygalactose transaminase|nr:DegT/DnrJ/EryC1/StrS family aminotransferase [Tolypothrix brevis GSE-NOS-MK-07-07A]
MTRKQPFKKPIYVTRPLLPDLDKFNQKLQEIWNSQWLTNNGKQHLELEHKLQQILKIPYLSLFNNGTIALIVGCQSLRLSGEVITTPFTFPGTPHVLTWNNIKPIFCDIDPVTMNIDANKIESMITPQTTAILGVHVYGTPCNVIKIQEIADKYGLKVIYDAAHAFGVEINGVGIGNFGDLSMMSFHATKLFHTAEGGALLFRDHNLKARVELLKNFGIKNEEEVVMPGINGKMNEIQAALGIVLLDYIEQERYQRQQLVETYRRYLKYVTGISLMPEISGVISSYQYFVIRIEQELFGCDRDYVHKQLKEYNVFTRKYFYPLCSDYPHYKYLPSSSSTNLLVANQVAKQVLSLPLYGSLNVDDVERICEMIIEIKG